MNFLIASEDNESPSHTDIADFEAEPSCIVGQVNVVTGNYIDFERDLTIVGAMPLTMERSLDSSHYRGSLKGGWNHNWNRSIDYEKKAKKHHHKHYYMTFTGSHGQEIDFDERVKQSKAQKLSFKPLQFERGVTNCSSGHLSGKTHIKNMDLILYKDQKECHIIKGDGSLLIFNKNKKHIFQFTKEVYPNRNSLTIEDNKDEQIIKSYSSSDRLLSWLKISKPKNWKHKPRVVVTGSDGRKVTYKYSKEYLEDKEDDEEYIQWSLSSVIRDDAPSVFYQFLQEDITNNGAVTGKFYPDNRFLNIKYYRYHHEQRHPKQDKKIKIRSREDHRLNKVMSLFAPVGRTSEAHKTHEFVYEKEGREKFFDKGKTTVYDAADIKTIYHHQKQRLTQLDLFDHNKALVSSEKLIWGPENSQLDCNLVSRYLEDPTGKRYFEKNYIYDGQHNVTEEHLQGRICSENQWSHFVKRSCYTQDIWNLLLRQEDEDVVYEQIYVPFTNKIAAKFERGKDGLCRRQFFEYDDAAQMTCEITDDGTGTLVDDYTNVTERRIRRFKLSEKGQAVEVSDFYVADDFTETLIRKEMNTYTSIGKLVKQDIYDENSQFVHSLYWEYDRHGHITKEINALGQSIVREYDANGNKTFEMGPSTEFHKRWSYDFMNRMIRADEVYPERTFSVHVDYDKLGRAISKTDCYGNTTHYTYDFRGRVLSTTSTPVSLEDGQLGRIVNRKEYDVLGYLSAEYDGKGNKTYRVNSIQGHPFRKQYPDGSCEIFEYDFKGRPTKFIAKDKQQTAWSYDSFGRIVEEQVNGTKIKTATYSTFHQLTETNANGLTVYYSYDKSGKKIKIDKGNFSTSYNYDALGRVSEVITCLNILKTEYDLLHRPIAERVYDHNHQLISEVKWLYDALGRKTHTLTTTDDSVHIDEKRYNCKGDLLWHRDAAGFITSYYFSYDYVNEKGLKVPYCESVDPKGRKSVTVCDTLGRAILSEKRGFDGTLLQKKEQFYNSLNQCVKSKEFVLEGERTVKEIINCWSWDLNGQLLSVKEGAGSPEQKITRYNYNSYGQKIEVIKPDAKRITYQYDAWGRVQSLIAFSESNDITLNYHYTYDLSGKPIEVADLITGSKTIRKYDQDEQLVEERLGNGVCLNYAYHLGGRLAETNVSSQAILQYDYQGTRLSKITRKTSSGTVLATAHYDRYDLSGKIREMTLPGGIKLSLKYDPLLRLTDTVSANWKQTKIEYDAVGNVLSFNQEALEENVNYDFEHDALNQLSSESGPFKNSFQHDSAQNLLKINDEISDYNSLNQPTHESYDLNGNLLEKEGCSFRYDALDRLIEVKDHNKVHTYVYDAFNRRLIDNERKFIYQDQNEIGCFENENLTEFRWLDSNLGKGAEVGASVAIEFDGNIYSALHDHQGNVSALYQLDGLLAASYRYSAFGTLETLSSLISPWLFSSKRWDSTSGLYFFGRRYYNPATHRFLTADPIKFDGGSNLYAYCSNRPLSLNDLYGLVQSEEDGAFWYGISAILTFLSHCTATPLNTTGAVISLPCASDIFQFPAHVISGRPISDYTPSYSRNHSVNGTLLGDNDVQGQGHYLVNGIDTPKDDFLDFVKDYQKSHGGVTVHYTYNGSRGWLTDLVECAMQKLGILTSPEIKLRQYIENILTLRGGPESEFKLNVLAHSQGGLIVGNLAYNLAPEFCKMMHVSTIGSASMIASKRFGSVVNYVSPGDIVPMTDLWGYAKGVMGNLGTNIVFLDLGLPFYDHLLISKPSQAALKTISNKFNENYR